MHSFSGNLTIESFSDFGSGLHWNVCAFDLLSSRLIYYLEVNVQIFVNLVLLLVRSQAHAYTLLFVTALHDHSWCGYLMVYAHTINR